MDEDILYLVVEMASERKDRQKQIRSLDEEILIHRCEDLLDVVTVPILKHYILVYRKYMMPSGFSALT